MTMSPAGLEMCKAFEGCSLTAYQDAVGIWTLGYGKIVKADGTRVQEGDTCTQAEADAGLLADIASDAEHFMRAWINYPLTQNQWDAIADFTFNRGCGRLRELLAMGSIFAETQNLLHFDYAGTPPVRLPGLARRRAAELLMFTNQDWHQVDDMQKYEAWKATQ